MARAKLLLVIPELCVGGAQQSLANLSRELSNDYTVNVVVFNQTGLHSYELGGPMLSLEVFPGKMLLSKVLAFFKRVRRLKKLKVDLSIDATISFLEGADYVNILSRANDKIIVSVRGSKYYDAEISGLIGWIRLVLLMPYLYKRADVIVSVSEGIKRELVEKMRLSSRKVVAISNFFSPPHFVDKSNQFPGIQSLQYLICVGRLHPQKNQAMLLRVFSKVIHSHPNLRLIFVGDGKDATRLIQVADELQLKCYTKAEADFVEDANVYFMGYHPSSFFIKHAMALILPSLWEGFPNVILEAMALGVPVIAADCETGPREMLADGKPQSKSWPDFVQYGVLLPLLTNDEVINVWSQAISALLWDEARLSHYATTGLERARHFRKEEIIILWKEVIENLIDSK